MAAAPIPAACPRCGNRSLRAQVLTWALYRDGVLEGIVVDGDVEPANEGIVRCDGYACDWQSPEALPP